MEHVSVEDVAGNVSVSGADRRRLSEPLGTAAVAINRYGLAPGERISGLHAHLDQEEVFVVLEGAVTFETWTPGGSDRSGETVRSDESNVGAGEAIRFSPGEFQSGKNDAVGKAVVLALGGPRDSEEVRIPLRCPDCGRPDRRPAVAEDGETPVLVCPACGTETDATCPECGHDGMYATVIENGTEPIGVCRDCGAESRA